MLTTSNEFEKTELNTNIDITSRIDIHSIIISEYLKDLPYDNNQIPIEIIALISKFYSSTFHSDKPIDSEIKQAIPSSCEHYDPIPSVKFKSSSCCSLNTLLSFPQFLLEIFIFILIFLNIASYYDFDKYWTPLALFLHPATIALYIFHVFIFSFHVSSIIYMPIKSVNDRVLALNYIFGTTPEIKFYIECADRRSGQKNRKVSFKKEEYVKLNQCDTIIEPNISDDNRKYRSMFYHFEFETLLHFDDEKDRLKYIELTKSFINNNIHDYSQRFHTSVRNTHINDDGNLCDDFHGFFFIVNSRCSCLKYILRFMLVLCTILCVSWICKLPLYFMSRRKKLTIIKYLSIDKLESRERRWY